MSIFKHIFGKKEVPPAKQEPTIEEQIKSLEAEKTGLQKWMSAGEGTPGDAERLEELNGEIERLRKQLPPPKR